MNKGNSTDIRNEATLQEIIRYGAVIRDIHDTAEQLHSLWQDQAGDLVFRRVCRLTEEMNGNCEGLKKWIGCGY